MGVSAEPGARNGLFVFVALLSKDLHQLKSEEMVIADAMIVENPSGLLVSTFSKSRMVERAAILVRGMKHATM